MLKILHVVAGLPPEGGISQSVPELCRHLVSEDVAVTLVTTGGAVSEAAMKAREAGVELVVCRPSWPAQLYFSIEMWCKLPILIKAADVVHVHSQWTFPVWWGCHLALKYKKPLIMTPRGCLAPERLKISAIKKRVVGWLFDRRYLRRASMIHATCECEAEAINKFMASASHELKWFKWLKWLSVSRQDANALSGKARKTGNSADPSALSHSRTLAAPCVAESEAWALPPIVVIPNGVDLATFDEVAADRASVDARWPECNGKHVAVFLSRIHPIKGIESLIAAWSEIEVLKNTSSSKVLKFESSKVEGVKRGEELGSWVLLIAGSGEDRYLAALRRQVADAGLNESIKFVGPVFGAEKIRLMKAAELFVLPTKNENFGIVVAEALACGVPVITTKGAPWQELLGKCASVEENFPRQGAKAQSNELTNSRTNAAPCVAESEAWALPPSGWWIDHGVEPLVEALQEAMALTDAERREMGQNGRRLVEAKYQWSAVARSMAAVYAGIATAE